MSRRCILFFLLFWLPLQGWGVGVMPYCRHGGMLWMQAAPKAVDEPCCPHHQPQHDSSTTQGCDACGLCHLASAPAAITVALQYGTISGGAPLPAITPLVPDFVPDSPDRPPRA